MIFPCSDATNGVSEVDWQKFTPDQVYFYMYLYVGRIPNQIYEVWHCCENDFDHLGLGENRDGVIFLWSRETRSWLQCLSKARSKVHHSLLLLRIDLKIRENRLTEDRARWCCWRCDGLRTTVLRTVGGSLLLQLGTQVGSSTPSTPLTPILRTSCQACWCSSAEKKRVYQLWFMVIYALWCWILALLTIHANNVPMWPDTRQIWRDTSMLTLSIKWKLRPPPWLPRMDKCGEAQQQRYISTFCLIHQIC